MTTNMITLLNLDEPVAAVAEPKTTEAAQRDAARSTLLRERDRLQTKADQLEAKVDELKELHRYELAIRCEVRGCRSVCSVSSSMEPAERLLARALIMAAITMQWKLGPDTVDQLRALTASTLLNAGADFDTCPNHPKENT